MKKIFNFPLDFFFFRVNITKYYEKAMTKRAYMAKKEEFFQKKRTIRYG